MTSARLCSAGALNSAASNQRQRKRESCTRNVYLSRRPDKYIPSWELAGRRLGSLAPFPARSAPDSTQRLGARARRLQAHKWEKFAKGGARSLGVGAPSQLAPALGRLSAKVCCFGESAGSQLRNTLALLAPCAISICFGRKRKRTLSRESRRDTSRLAARRLDPRRGRERETRRCCASFCRLLRLGAQSNCTLPPARRQSSLSARSLARALKQLRSIAQ